ncbi:hypothetical protein EDB84DRAFT_1677169, partial [Lactarius hengduanensis]
MSQTPATIPSSSNQASNIEGIFDAALKSYKKKTKKDIEKHDLFKRLEQCNSPAAILAAFQADQFDPSRTGGNDRLKKWLLPTINVLYAFSATLSEGVGLVNVNSSVFSPARVVFAGVGVLLLAAKDVAAGQDILVDIFEHYTGVPLTPAMTEKMVQITVEVLDIIATATKELVKSRTKKFLKRMVGRTDLEDGLKKLDKLTNDQVMMATVQLLKITHNIDKGLTVGLTGVSNDVKAVDDKVQTIADDGKATATEVKSILRQTADNVDGV